jgi:DNA modification methylase
LDSNWDLNELKDVGFDELVKELSVWENDPNIKEEHALADKFVIPPFSVLDARQGYWRERKRAWIALGIKSELGRGSLSLQNSLTPKGYWQERKRAWKCKNEGVAFSETSIFDPVLCEIVYRWFCPNGGSVIDPFAGGSVRGIVAGYLGHPYTGIDLRAEQIAANEMQATAIQPKIKPSWICGNSEKIAELAPGNYDLVFSCPPYYNLEVYSDIAGDLSTIGTYDEFITVYRAIIAQCCGMLNDNRFACFVVGDIRDKKGFYQNFCADTTSAFEDAGCTLYNEGILVTMLGPLALEINSIFKYRKLGKCHQNVLIYFKGNPKKIKEEFGVVSIPTEIL